MCGYELFTVEPDRAEALIEALTHSTEETFRSKKGFISVNLHMSRDHKRVVNYAQWQSKEDYDPAFKTPEVSQAGNMCSGRLRAVSANSATARKRQFSDFIKAT